MNTPSVKTFRALRMLKVKVRRDDSVQISKVGSHYKARFRGRANSVFGSSAEEARQRLFSTIAKRWGITPVQISNFEKQLLEACR